MALAEAVVAPAEAVVEPVEALAAPVEAVMAPQAVPSVNPGVLAWVYDRLVLPPCGIVLVLPTSVASLAECLSECVT